MLQLLHWKLCQKYIDAIEQNALSRRVKAALAAAAAQGAIGGGSMVHRLDFDSRLHRLAAAAVPLTMPLP